MPVISPPQGTGSVGSAEITDLSIVNADVAAAAAIVGSKLDLTSGTKVISQASVTEGYHEMHEQTAAPAAVATKARIYAIDNGGKTELLARFETGASVRLAIEP